MVKPGTHWRQIDSRQNWRQIGDKVDCRLSPICRRYFRLNRRFIAGLSKVDCRRLIRLCRPNVERPFGFVASVYGALCCLNGLWRRSCLSMPFTFTYSLPCYFFKFIGFCFSYFLFLVLGACKAMLVRRQTNQRAIVSTCRVVSYSIWKHEIVSQCCNWQLLNAGEEGSQS